METKNLAEMYDLEPLAWDAVAARLDAGFTLVPGTGGPDRHSAWVTTINPDGSPHTTGIGVVWVDGSFWFETGETTRKGRNVARDPRCSVSLALKEYDVVVEGRAVKIEDPAVVARMAAVWAEEWPCKVDESGVALTADFSAPSAGKPPWHVYRVEATSAVALETVEPGGATRWHF